MITKIAGNILVIDAFVNLVTGFVLFFAPDKVGDFVFQRETDGIHWHLIRCVGGQLIATAFVLYRLGHRAPETRTACFVLRVMSSILTIFLFWHAKSVHPTLLEPVLCKTIIYLCAAAIASSVIFLITSGWPLGKDLHDSPVGNFLYQLDSIASVTIGMAWISHPQWLLHRQVSISMDESHEFCGQMMGVLFVSSQVLAMHALYWKEHEDRSLAAEARAICCVFILMGQVWSQFAYGAHWSGGHWVGISLFSTWTVISIFYRISIYFTVPTDPQQYSRKRN